MFITFNTFGVPPDWFVELTLANIARQDQEYCVEIDVTW
jgi:hypothetical protein